MTPQIPPELEPLIQSVLTLREQHVRACVIDALMGLPAQKHTDIVQIYQDLTKAQLDLMAAIREFRAKVK